MRKQSIFKKLSFLLALVMIMSSLCVPVAAEEPLVLTAIPDNALYDESGYAFTVFGLDSATIVGYDETQTSLENPTIPSVVSDYDDESGETYTVKYVASSAFEDDGRLEGTLTISAGIDVSTKAFMGCEKLTALVLDKDVKWDDDAFKNCTGLQMVINNTSTAFKFDRLATGKSWKDKDGNGISSIANGTAYREDYVRNTHTVSFETNGGNDIKNQVVDDGAKATKPTPDPKKDGFIFDGWYADDKLTTVYDFGKAVNADITIYAKWKEEAGSGKKHVDSDSKLSFVVNEDGATATITMQGDEIPTTITEIPEDLEVPSQVKLKDKTYTVTAIDDSAFECTGYNGKLIIPDTVTSIGKRAFADCFYLKGDIKLPAGLLTIGDEAFKMGDTTRLDGTLDLGTSLVSIGNGAFENCSALTGDLVLPDTVETVGDYAFCNCLGFNGKLSLGKNLKTIGKYAFTGSTNHYGVSNFTGNLAIPDGVTEIGEYAFYNCQKLSGNLSLGKSLVTIGYKAFGYCGGFTGNLLLPDTLTTIGESAFSDCKGFTGNLVIPDSVEYIGGMAFESCTGLGVELVIGEKVQRVDKTVVAGTDMSGASFYLCTGIKKVVNKSAVEIELDNIRLDSTQYWMDAVGTRVEKAPAKSTVYRSDFSGDKTASENSASENQISENKASDVREEPITVPGLEGGDQAVIVLVYPHKVPFFGKGKVDLNYFTKDGAKFTVSFNNQTLDVAKIKVNKKKKRIQIIKINGADKALQKAIKKATKGDNGLPFETVPYVVSDNDQVKPKFNKKDGTLKFAKVTINGKPYKLKGDVLLFNPVVNTITFKDPDVIGSFTVK